MSPETLMRMCLGGTLAGLLLLYALLEVMRPPEVEIEELYSTPKDEHVRMRGVVRSISTTGAITIIELGTYRTVPVMIFDDGRSPIFRGQSIRVDGRVQEFKGKKELIADEVAVLNDSTTQAP